MEFGQRVCQIAAFRALTPEALSRAAILSACATQCRLALANQALMNECDGSRLRACVAPTLIRERFSDGSHQQTISRATGCSPQPHGLAGAASSVGVTLITPPESDMSTCCFVPATTRVGRISRLSHGGGPGCRRQETCHPPLK